MLLHGLESHVLRKNHVIFLCACKAANMEQACYDKTEAKCNPDDSIGTCFNKCWA
jgi:hypothetical protein